MLQIIFENGHILKSDVDDFGLARPAHRIPKLTQHNFAIRQNLFSRLIKRSYDVFKISVCVIPKFREPAPLLGRTFQTTLVLLKAPIKPGLPYPNPAQHVSRRKIPETVYEWNCSKSHGSHSGHDIPIDAMR